MFSLTIVTPSNFNPIIFAVSDNVPTSPKFKTSLFVLAVAIVVSLPTIFKFLNIIKVILINQLHT